MYAFATHWTCKAGSAEEVEEVNRKVLIPALAEQPGFRQSFAIQIAGDSYPDRVRLGGADPGRGRA